MQFKRLRSSKTIESLSVAKLSQSAKEQLSEAVCAQFVETMKIRSDYEEVSDEINSKGHLILKTAHDFNEYCEIIAGSAKLNPQKTEICSYLYDICLEAERYVKKKNQSFIRKIPDEKIFVNIDKERFCYAVLNVILNSAENTPKGEKIRIFVSKTKKFVKIIIGDNGFGMDKESVLHCFEPFYSKTKTSQKGKMGLGLTLTRNFVTESGGRISISSEEGKGTAVSMLFPLIRAEETNLVAESPVPDILGGKFSPVSIVFSALTKD